MSLFSVYHGSSSVVNSQIFRTISLQVGPAATSSLAAHSWFLSKRSHGPQPVARCSWQAHNTVGQPHQSSQASQQRLHFLALKSNAPGESRQDRSKRGNQGLAGGLLSMSAPCFAYIHLNMALPPQPRVSRASTPLTHMQTSERWNKPLLSRPPFLATQQTTGYFTEKTSHMWPAGGEHCVLGPKCSVTPSLLSGMRSVMIPLLNLRLRILFPGRTGLDDLQRPLPTLTIL